MLGTANFHKTIVSVDNIEPEILEIPNSKDKDESVDPALNQAVAAQINVILQQKTKGSREKDQKESTDCRELQDEKCSKGKP